MITLKEILVLGIVASGCSSPPPRALLIRAGRVFDGSGAPVRDKLQILITDGVIERIDPDDGRPAPGGVVDVDARKLTIMPGMVDAHTHLFLAGSCNPQISPDPLTALRNLRALLRGGVTAVADLGAQASLAIALRRHAGTARHRGPRVFVSGPILTAAGGYPSDFMGPGAVREVTSPDQGVQIIRELAAFGVDFVKVALQEKSYNGQLLPMLDEESLCAITKEARRQELRVLAHATTRAGYERALTCGVNVLMHGLLEPLDDNLLNRLKERRVSIAPTLNGLRKYASRAAANRELLPDMLMPELSRAVVEESVSTNLANTRKLNEARVPLGLGTDGGSCFNFLGSPLEELSRLEQAGLTPTEVLRVATLGGAQLLGLGDALGRIQVGYRADLIGIAGRPDEDLRDIANVRLVLLDGVQQKLDTPEVGEKLELLWRFLWASILN